MKSMKPECDVFSTTLYSDAFSSQYICCVCALTFVGRFGQKIQFRNNTSEFNQINVVFCWLFSQFQQVCDFSHQYFGIYKLIWNFVLKKSGKKLIVLLNFILVKSIKTWIIVSTNTWSQHLFFDVSRWTISCCCLTAYVKIVTKIPTVYL